MSDDNEDNRPLPGAMPCPFCGGTKIATYAGSTFRWRYAACNECGAQASEVRIETILLPRDQAIEVADRELLGAWNTRALPPEGREQEAFAKGAAAQREADLAMFAKWQTDIELPWGGMLKSRHTFNVDYPEFVRTEPLVKP